MGYSRREEKKISAFNARTNHEIISLQSNHAFVYSPHIMSLRMHLSKYNTHIITYIVRNFGEHKMST